VTLASPVVSLTLREVDEDVVASSPTGLGLVHVDQDAPAGRSGL